MSTPGASSHVPGQLGFSPAATTPQGSPGEANGWEPGQRPPSSGAGSQNDVGSLKGERSCQFWTLVPPDAIPGVQQ
eukprot:12896707-Prorocentrum_lima.AAC.1